MTIDDNDDGHSHGESGRGGSGYHSYCCALSQLGVHRAGNARERLHRREAGQRHDRTEQDVFDEVLSAVVDQQATQEMS